MRAWRELGRRERYVWNKLITGSFRVGASARLVVRALAEVSGVDEGTIAHRLMGAWEPTPEFFERLIAPDTRDADVSRPYPFYLAYPLEQEPAALGEPGDWLAEWKWDGIRAQLIRRAGRTFLWSRGEELLSGRFPEVEEAAALLPEGTVLDGELLPWVAGAPLPFAQLQRRIGRKTLGRKILSEVPVVLVAYDLLEERGEDLRGRPFAERRAAAGGAARRGAVGRPAGALARRGGRRRGRRSTRARARAREAGAEGLMLKRRASAYGVGRRRGDWWKWKVEPHSVDAVLIYAQPGSGRRAGPLHRLHLRRLGRRSAGPVRQGLLRADRRGDPPSRRLRPAQHAGEVRAGAHREAGARLRAGVRGHSALDPAQVRGRGALSPDGPVADGQAAGGGGHAGDGAGD